MKFHREYNRHEQLHRVVRTDGAGMRSLERSFASPEDADQLIAELRDGEERRLRAVENFRQKQELGLGMVIKSDVQWICSRCRVPGYGLLKLYTVDRDVYLCSPCLLAIVNKEGIGE